MSIAESKSPSSRAIRRLMLALCTLALLSVASIAWAYGGRVHWTNTHPKERDGDNWHLEVAIYMSRAPDVPHVPMKFEFKPTAVYERDLVDGDKIVERKQPLTNQQDIIEDVDVGFLDPSNGKIQKRTKFSFKITRAHGFVAGEYKITVRDARNGHIIGRPTKLVLNGKNKAVDRRTMVFSGEKKKKKKKDDMKHVDRNGDIKDDNGGGPGDKAASSDSGDQTAGADDAAGSSEPAPGSEDDIGDDGDNGANGGPKPIKEKPGCNCRMERTSHGTDAAGWLLSLGLVFAFGLRRRR